jgi:tetratricopeptide (TPR) repeat protein
MENDKDSRLFSLLNSFLDEKGDGSNDTSLLPLSLPTDYAETYLKDRPDEAEAPAESAIRQKAESLSEDFKSTVRGKETADSSPVPESGIGSVSSPQPCQTSGSVSGPADESYDEFDPDTIDDSFFTETLARIYLKQHRYDKALEIIRSLYLNFPNKSIYFADQIRYLEKLIRINQKTENTE